MIALMQIGFSDANSPCKDAFQLLVSAVVRGLDEVALGPAGTKTIHRACMYFAFI